MRKKTHQAIAQTSSEVREAQYWIFFSIETRRKEDRKRTLRKLSCLRILFFFMA